MRRLVRAAVALSIVLGSTAHAGTAVTPMIRRETAQNDVVSCMVLNAGKKPIGPFTIEIVQNNGVNATSATNVSSLGPGIGTFTSTANGGSFVYCRVEGKFSPKKVRVSLCVWESNSDETCMAAVTAP